MSSCPPGHCTHTVPCLILLHPYRKRMEPSDWQNDTVFRTLMLGRKFIEAEERKQRDWELRNGHEPSGPTPLDKARE